VKDDRVFLGHVLASLDKIAEYTKDGRASFMASTLIQDAVMRNFEIIGEATKRLTAETRALRPEIPWKQVAGLRDVLIHGYMVWTSMRSGRSLKRTSPPCGRQ
jgi:uncharacterized protein with HEPN domain